MVSAVTTTSDSQDPASAYLMAADECGRQGVGSAACAKAMALQGAALAAGLDPALANAARSCIESGDVEGCARAGATAGVTAACVAATEGAGALVCGPLAAAIVSFAWPIVWGVLSSVGGAAVSLVSVGLEAVGLKDKPEFSDLANPMYAKVLGQFNTAIPQSAEAITQAIQKTRAALGLQADNTIFVRKSRQTPDGLGWEWSDEGTYMWLNAAAESLIWDRLGNDATFAAGFSHETGYGQVGLQAGLMGSDRKANIESAYTLVSLKPWWGVKWDYAWQRDEVFQRGADALSKFYGYRIQALQDAVQAAMRTMAELEAVNPHTVEAVKRAEQSRAIENLRREVAKPQAKPAGSGGVWAAIGSLVVVAGGVVLWTRHLRAQRPG